MMIAKKQVFPRFSFLIVWILMSVLAVPASASASEKPVLVLFPIEVGMEDAAYVEEYGTALFQGLKERYKVYYGPDVEKELQKEYEKVDCNAERCAMNVAIAFNGELVADASAKQLGDGYVLKMVVRNVITGEMVETISEPCRGCDGFAVMERFKQIGRGHATAAAGTGITIVNNGGSGSTAQDAAAIFIFDSAPSGASVSINGKDVGTTPYQGLDHRVGEQLEITLTKTFFQPLTFQTTLQGELTRLQKPVELKPGEGQLLVSLEPYQPGMQVSVDGQPRGELPQKLRLLAGERKILITHKGKKIAAEKVVVSHGMDEKLVVGAGTVNAPTHLNPALKSIFDALVKVPGGRFIMGDNRGERDVQPARNVSVSEFLMMAHEVTWAQYQPCVDAGVCQAPDDAGWGQGDLPVINVSWLDVQTYIQWLNQQTGKTFRLPSEAEWEYAARAGTNTQFSWGDLSGTNNANCNGCGSAWDNKKTAPVKSFQPNPFGLYDMHGNVYEWVQDCWNESYHGAPATSVPRENGDCNKRVLRGGAWFFYPSNMTVVDRYWNQSTSRYNSFGFRLALGK